MSTETPGGKLPEPDPREPTGPKPSTRTRVWVLFLAIIGVIIILAVSTWLITGALPGATELEEQNPPGAEFDE